MTLMTMVSGSARPTATSRTGLSCLTRSAMAPVSSRSTGSSSCTCAASRTSSSVSRLVPLTWTLWVANTGEKPNR
nr:hypothetical protein [Tessaracoccus aquimaris]